MRRQLTVAMLLALLTTAGRTQSRADEEKRLAVHALKHAPGPSEHMFDGQHVAYIKSELAFDSKVVKGAPYSAEALTETTQTLVDGNRIHQVMKASLYRDSEGRTRREQSLGAVGPLTSGQKLQTIFINDPVADVNYMLNTRTHEAIQSGSISEMKLALGRKLERKLKEGMNDSPGQVQKESLGTQTIEGVAAEGTRTTMTMPAGAIGNERPIAIVSERWYSPQLQTTVMTRVNDPRTGETVYKLTNINLAEPPHSLFEVPADYTIKTRK